MKYIVQDYNIMVLLLLIIIVYIYDVLYAKKKKTFLPEPLLINEIKIIEFVLFIKHMKND